MPILGNFTIQMEKSVERGGKIRQTDDFCSTCIGENPRQCTTMIPSTFLDSIVKFFANNYSYIWLLFNIEVFISITLFESLDVFIGFVCLIVSSGSIEIL
jgi:hypothetical protein